MKTLDQAWRDTLLQITTEGHVVAPRGLKTLELLHHRVDLDPHYCVLTNPLRKLNYRFMAAEAYWLMTGDDRVATIAPYNPNIAQFSDDGETFAGAYGPRIEAQLAYVVETLRRDPHSRQATMTIWRPNPAPSKDIPCTVAFVFQLRNNELHLLATMRSSDAWLGLPYDAFNFSVLLYRVASRLTSTSATGWVVRPGRLTLMLSSSHLYETHWEAADRVLADTAVYQPARPLPAWYLRPESTLLEDLRALRETRRGDPERWWELRFEDAAAES